MNTRQTLQQEFIELRNAKMARPKEGRGKREMDIYYDYLNDSDVLAEAKTDDELQDAINTMKGC